MAKNGTDNEIITALELLEILVCETDAQKETVCSALDLINRLQADNERLQKENNLFADFGNVYSEIKAEAIEEFAERFLKIVHDNHYLLVDRINSKDYGMFTIGIEQAVDETKKEMVGDTE